MLSAKTADGTTVYLCPRMGAAGYPSSTTSDNITFVANEDGTFHLKASNYGGYLYFWRNGKKMCIRDRTRPGKPPAPTDFSYSP